MEGGDQQTKEHHNSCGGRKAFIPCYALITDIISTVLSAGDLTCSMVEQQLEGYQKNTRDVPEGKKEITKIELLYN